MGFEEMFKSAEETAAIVREQVSLIADDMSPEERAAFKRLTYMLIAADYLNQFGGDRAAELEWYSDVRRLAEERKL